MSNKLPAGALDLEKIQNALYDWVWSVAEGVMGKDPELRITWRNQGEPIPPRPFVSLKFIDGPRPIGRSPNFYSLKTVNDKTVNYGMQHEATLSVQVFGNTRTSKPLANQLAVDLNSSLMRQTILDALKVGGVAIQGLGSVKNLSALEESDYEERAGFELALGLVQNVQDTPVTIGTVNVGGTASGKPVNVRVTL
jgi:hypothetical protein